MPPTSRPRSRWKTDPRCWRRPTSSRLPGKPSPTLWACQARRRAMNAEKLRMLFDLTGRTAIITGGTRGIGFALAQGHLAAGANVVITGRSQDRCRAAQSQLEIDAPGRVAAVAAHMGDLDQVKHLVQQT